ncbi:MULTISPECIES: hypothetical protein [unclassified Ensifer]|nr:MULTISPECIES: hypothetical protein [unclassified Ensifer]MBD9573582.1 hypothetical protein [Ensifer sp. ENS08]
MGFTPQQIRAMSMWQFMAALDGFIAANSPEDTGLTAKEADELWDWLEAG